MQFWSYCNYYFTTCKWCSHQLLRYIGVTANFIKALLYLTWNLQTCLKTKQTLKPHINQSRWTQKDTDLSAGHRKCKLGMINFLLSHLGRHLYFLQIRSDIREGRLVTQHKHKPKLNSPFPLCSIKLLHCVIMEYDCRLQCPLSAAVVLASYAVQCKSNDL